MAFLLFFALVAANLIHAQTTVVELQSVTTPPFYLKTSSSTTLTLSSTAVAIPAVPLSTTLPVSHITSDTTSADSLRSSWSYAPPSSATQSTYDSPAYSLIQSNTPSQDTSFIMSTSTFNALSVLSCAIATFESGVSAPCIATSTDANNFAIQTTVTLTALTQVTNIATAAPSTTLQVISASTAQAQGVTIVVLPGQPASTTVETDTQIFTSTMSSGNLPVASSTTQITDGFAGISTNTALSTATTLVTSTSVSTITTGLGGIIVGASGTSSAASQTPTTTPAGSAASNTGASGASSGTASSNIVSGTGSSGTASGTASGPGGNVSSSTRTSGSAGASSGGSPTATRTSITTVTTNPAASNTAAGSNGAASTTAVRSATITPAPVASQGPFAGASAIKVPYLLGGFAAALAAIFAQ